MNIFIFDKKSNYQMLRTIIIDDEAHVRKTISSLVETYCPTVQLVSYADGVRTGLEAIKKYRPDVVLLDIKMKDGTGFDLLKKINSIDFKIIFITAYDQFAVQAFKFSAIDYLLKPVDPEDLVQALERAEQTLKKDITVQLQALEENLDTKEKGRKKIVIKTTEKIYLILISDLVFIEADGSYSKLHLKDGNILMTSRALKDFEEMLNNQGFFRVHKSYLINLSAIREFERAGGGYLVLSEGSKVPVSSRKKEHLLSLFNQLT
jgi:two-component system LytT family response regulator